MVQAPANKDFYSVLQVHPQASMQQIKKAYRQLAFRFHPDTNPLGDALCDAVFREITEAYRILSDPDLRRAYDKENFYTSSSLFYKNSTEWNNRLEFLKKYVRNQDHFRINRDGLCYCIEILLEPNYLHWLPNEDNTDKQKILNDLIFLCGPLTADQCKKIKDLLNTVLTSDSSKRQIKFFLQHKLQKEKLHGSMVWIAFIAAVIFCVLMYILTQS